MGKGDIKSKKGKISNGSFGVKRKRKSGTATVAATPKAAVATEEKAKTKKVKN